MLVERDIIKVDIKELSIFIVFHAVADSDLDTDLCWERNRPFYIFKRPILREFDSLFAHLGYKLSYFRPVLDCQCSL